MYWNHPIIHQQWPSNHDAVKQSLHDGTHCLLYDPAVLIAHIQPQQTLQELCNLANYRIRTSAPSNFFTEPDLHDWIANLVKIHMMIPSLCQLGSVKPLLLSYPGCMPFEPLTGDSRLKALTRLPNIKSVPAFITTRAELRSKFSDLVAVETFDQFAEICCVAPGTGFAFRPTDALAPYGLDWFEYSVDTVNVPAIEWCLTVLKNYLISMPSDFAFSPEWFDQTIDWNRYQ